MRTVVLLAGLVLATNALAEDSSPSAARELDKSSPQLAQSSSSSDATAARELDKSSPMLMRSSAPNDSSSSGDRAVVTPRDAASGMPTGKRQHAAAPSGGDGGDYNSSRSNKTHAPTVCSDGVDNDCDGAASEAPANHNTTRSNRTLRVTQPSGSATGQSRAQDYNSSRSNTDGVRLDDDSDGDSLREVRCSTVSDECVDAGDGDDLVLRKRPGKR